MEIAFLLLLWYCGHMHVRSSKPDVAQNALRVVEETIGGTLAEPKKPIPFPVRGKKKNPAAVALGKLGGRKGGRARAEKLSPERRKAIAQRAAQARWAKEEGQ